jgi:dolichol-phosphate mannosyltransferase
MRWIGRLLLLAQIAAALRVFNRMARTANGRRIEPAPAPEGDRVTVIVPVLNEERRLGPCLDGLVAQGLEVAEILVVDGGSTDGTRALVARYEALDRRVRFVDATPVPAGINGKAHNLRAGAAVAQPDAHWLLTIDADVRPRTGLVAALLAHARRERLNVLSAATRQRVSSWGDGLLHPALLTTLVYRYGIPGSATADWRAVQANGQCMLLRAEVLRAAGGFGSVLDSICEDVTLARELALTGERVGFYEAGDLISVEMYAGWRETWSNWTRSLPMRDRYSGLSAPRGLIEVTLVQALPLWLVLGARGSLRRLNAGLLLARIGVLVGMRRAYVDRPPSYWLSPVCDLPATIQLWLMLSRRRHMWRGRPLVRGGNR